MIWEKFYKSTIESCEEDNCLVVTYESLLRSMPHEMEQVLRFIQFPLTNELIQCLIKEGEGKFKNIKSRSKSDIATIKKIISQAVNMNITEKYWSFVDDMKERIHYQVGSNVEEVFCKNQLKMSILK